LCGVSLRPGCSSVVKLAHLKGFNIGKECTFELAPESFDFAGFDVE